MTLMISDYLHAFEAYTYQHYIISTLSCLLLFIFAIIFTWWFVISDRFEDKGKIVDIFRGIVFVFNIILCIITTGIGTATGAEWFDVVDKSIEKKYVKHKTISNPTFETDVVDNDENSNEIKTIVKTTIIQNGIARTATINLTTDELTSENIKDISESISKSYQKINEQRLTDVR